MGCCACMPSACSSFPTSSMAAKYLWVARWTHNDSPRVISFNSLKGVSGMHFAVHALIALSNMHIKNWSKDAN